MMKIKGQAPQNHLNNPHPTHAVFVRGIRGSDSIIHDRKPQIAFVGRSNVGKSSTVNALLNAKLARTSSTPGKTQEINFFEVGLKPFQRNGSPLNLQSKSGEQKTVLADSWNEFRGYFVDLPGYGYAKMPEREKEKIRKHILWYLSGGEAKPKLLVLVLDARIGVTDYDRDLIRIARDEKHPVLLLANKIDKLTKNERAKALTALAQEFPDVDCIPFSATKKENVSVVRTRLFSLMGIRER